MSITRDQANEIKRLAGLYAGAPYLAAYSQEFVDAQVALHSYIDNLVVAEAVPLDGDRIEAIAHRTASSYWHDPENGHTYAFKRHTLEDFAARLMAEALKEAPK